LDSGYKKLEKPKMTKRGVALAAPIVSLILLVQLIGAIGCQIGKSESDSFIATAYEAVNARIKWLDEQKFKSPEPPASLNVTIDSVESNTHRIGRDGVGGG
jgi:hypothetical protein